MEKKRSPLIQSLQRAVDILNCFTEQEPSLTLPQISQMTGLNINTARGLVNTLVHDDLISHHASDNTYSLGLYFVMKSNLIYQTRSLGSLGDIARPYMHEITEKYSIFSSLQVVNQTKIFMIETEQPRLGHYRLTAQLYAPFECYCTSSGKLYLQYLSEAEREIAIRNMNFVMHTPNTIMDGAELLKVLKKQEKTRYATEYDEMAVGISSIAAPILLPGGRLYGTISVTATSQILKANQRSIAADLLDAGEEIAKSVALSTELMF